MAKGEGDEGEKVVEVATRTNALWQSCPDSRVPSQCLRSQPARMRCGKEAQLAAPAEKILVATRANALRQSRAIVVPEPEAPKI